MTRKGLAVCCLDQDITYYYCVKYVVHMSSVSFVINTTIRNFMLQLFQSTFCVFMKVQLSASQTIWQVLACTLVLKSKLWSGNPFCNYEPFNFISCENLNEVLQSQLRLTGKWFRFQNVGHISVPVLCFEITRGEKQKRYQTIFLLVWEQSE